MDPRTGLGRFKDYRISNYQLMEEMIQHCRSKTAEEILEIPDVKERLERFQSHKQPFIDMLDRCTELHENVIVTNFLNEDTIYCGNRFMIFALHPEQNIEIRLQWCKKMQYVSLSCGHSIVNRTSRTNVAKLMLKYGGGGHKQVGACQTTIDFWNEVLEELIEQMVKDG